MERSVPGLFVMVHHDVQIPPVLGPGLCERVSQVTLVTGRASQRRTPMADTTLEGIVERYEYTSREFGLRVTLLPANGWDRPTTCSEWSVRALVNHVTRGNLSYIALAGGGSAVEFLRMRDCDALGDDPRGAYEKSWTGCATAFRQPGVLAKVLDYPLGPVSGAQALAVRTADTVIHTWDLARSVGAGEALDPALVEWVLGGLDDIYAGLAEGPTDPHTTHRFFGPVPTDRTCSGDQDRLLRLMGRDPLAERPRQRG
jgi:uncharacterized protein (TIGR03086 family)